MNRADRFIKARQDKSFGRFPSNLYKDRANEYNQIGEPYRTSKVVNLPNSDMYHVLNHLSIYDERSTKEVSVKTGFNTNRTLDLLKSLYVKDLVIRTLAKDSRGIQCWWWVKLS